VHKCINLEEWEKCCKMGWHMNNHQFSQNMGNIEKQCRPLERRGAALYNDAKFCPNPIPQ